MLLRLRVLLAAAALAGRAQALSPVASCASLAAVRFSGEEAANISVLSATRNDTADHPHMGFRRLEEEGPAPPNISYCLVKVLVQPAINIWVGLPSDGSWNGRFQAMGGGGYAGQVSAPLPAVQAGYVGSTTDTGHKGGDGSFGMLKPGVPNTQLQDDFAYRSEHMMAVVAKQLIQHLYGKPPVYSFWNGCSTGGRQALMMAQRFPKDYNGILAGAPAIHWDKFQVRPAPSPLGCSPARLTGCAAVANAGLPDLAADGDAARGGWVHRRIQAAGRHRRCHRRLRRLGRRR
jgi:hypothetical protein